MNGMKVADFGCGSSGFFVLPIAQIVGFEGKVFSVDVQKEAVESIKNRAKSEGLENIQAIWSDLEKPKATDIAENSIDLGLVINVLFQVKDVQAFLTECSRFIKKDKRL